MGAGSSVFSAEASWTEGAGLLLAPSVTPSELRLNTAVGSVSSPLGPRLPALRSASS